jgi:hypothetical protein
VAILFGKQGHCEFHDTFLPHAEHLISHERAATLMPHRISLRTIGKF